MLELKDLHAAVDGKAILRGLTLTIRPGEVHAIMGPNGAGKSTLGRVICGHEAFEVTGGDVCFEGQSLLEMAPEERAQAGIFMSFQHPVEIPGVSTSYFLKAAMNAVRKARGEPELDAVAFLKLARQKMKGVEMSKDLLNRSLNEGFSGGEKKRNEIFQMAMLEPKLAVLDEMDSGLDVDALRVIAGGVNALRTPERAMLVITHYQRLLDHIEPDRVHVLAGGRILMSGSKDLARQLEAQGYTWVREESGATT